MAELQAHPCPLVQDRHPRRREVTGGAAWPASGPLIHTARLYPAATAALSSVSDVVSVVLELVRRPDATRSTDLGLLPSPPSTILANSDFGSDLVIGILYTGISLSCRSFSSRSLAPALAAVATKEADQGDLDVGRRHRGGDDDVGREEAGGGRCSRIGASIEEEPGGVEATLGGSRGGAVEGCGTVGAVVTDDGGEGGEERKKKKK